ncbi:MAG: HAD family hydrolase [Eubacterium sp.]|nr:HAD family hydrolase [Eubacterium sp.]
MKVIFWDFDGTLVYSNPLWSNSVYNALKSVDGNTTVTFSEIRKLMASGFTWHMPNENYTEFTNEKWWQYMNHYFYSCYLSLNTPQNIAEQATAKIRDIIKKKENYTLYSDAVSTLKKLKSKGIKNVILSNNYPDLCDVLKELEIYDLFDDFVISAAVGYDKPRKEIFEIAENFYPNADEYYMVGDSVNADIVGGNCAGFKTILVHKGFCEKADYCFDDLKSIVDLF